MSKSVQREWTTFGCYIVNGTAEKRKMGIFSKYRGLGGFAEGLDWTTSIIRNCQNRVAQARKSSHRLISCSHERFLSKPTIGCEFSIPRPSPDRTTIGIDDLPGDVARLITDQKTGQPGDVLWQSPALQRSLANDPLLPSRTRSVAPSCLDPTG